jgi:hypothetical protein
MESGRTAFSAIGLAPEFSTCALAGAANVAAARSSAAIVPNLVCIRIAHFILESDLRDG